MKKLIIAVCVISLVSCKKKDDLNFWPIHGKGNSEVNTVSLSPFTGIKLETDAEIYIDTTNTTSVRIEAQQNTFNNLRFDMSGDILEIDSKHPVSHSKKVKIYIGNNTLNTLRIEGSGQISVPEGYRTSALMLAVEGCGEILVRNIQTKQITSEITGSGNISVSGVTDRQKIKISDSGNYYGIGCESNIADIDLSGSGNSEVSVHEHLTAAISGSGNIRYKGTPVVTASISGSGHVSGY